MNTQLIKLRSSKIPYNSQVVIPRVYVEDNSICTGDVLEIYRGTINGKDAIIILPAITNTNISDNNYKNLVKVDKKQETV